MASLTKLYHPPDNPTPTHSSSYPFINPSKYRGALNGKVVLITGAGRGIGRETALAFQAAGARVACISRTRSDLLSLYDLLLDRYADEGNRIAELQGDVGRAIYLPGDVTDPDFAPRAVKYTEEHAGPIDILINNAGLSRVSDLEHENSVKEPWRVIETSLLGSMSFTQAVLPSMIARHTGTILNVVSIIGKVTLPYFSAYAAAKAGLMKYTEVINLELKLKGIKTFAVHPCMTLDTTIARPPCMNEAAMQKVPDIGNFMQDFVQSNTDHVDLPSDTFVALCCEERASVLSGKFVDATYDLEEQIKEAEQEVKPVDTHQE